MRTERSLDPESAGLAQSSRTLYSLPLRNTGLSQGQKSAGPQLARVLRPDWVLGTCLALVGKCIRF